MSWCEESSSVLNPELVASAEDDAPASAPTPESETDQAPRQGFGDLPATQKVTSLEKLLAGDAKRDPEKEEPGDEQPEH